MYRTRQEINIFLQDKAKINIYVQENARNKYLFRGKGQK